MRADLDRPEKHGAVLTIPPAWWLLAVVLGTTVVVAGLTAIPARIGARRPVAEILQSETARPWNDASAGESGSGVNHGLRLGECLHGEPAADPATAADRP